MTDLFRSSSRTRARGSAKPASSDEVLGALRDYIDAEVAMRTRSRVAMGLNMTDMAAIRFLVESHQNGARVSPKDLAAKLSISTASVSVMLDRLEKGGQVDRTDNPDDGRGFFILPTERAMNDLAETLGGMRGRVERAVEAMSAADADVVVDFLRRIRDAVDASVRTS